MVKLGIFELELSKSKNAHQCNTQVFNSDGLTVLDKTKMLLALSNPTAFGIHRRMIN